MNANTRIQLLRSLASDVHQVHLTVPEVREIDNYLVKDWGIDLVTKPNEIWMDELLQPLEPSVRSRYDGLLRQVRSALETGNHAADLVREFFDIQAQDLLAGRAQSSRRSVILDSIAEVLFLVRKLEIQGPILDLGCYVGYLPIFLAGKCPNEVVGVDLSPESIKYAQSRSASLVNADFQCLDYMSTRMEQRFELIVSIDSIDPRVSDMRKALSWIADHLLFGGVAFIICDFQQLNEAALSRYINTASLGFGLADRVGGWLCQSWQYRFGSALVLLKGGSKPLPKRAFDWTDYPFAEYASMTGAPRREQTQAYFRAKLADPELAKRRLIREALADYHPELMMATMG